jgi:hypothetical protein
MAGADAFLTADLVPSVLRSRKPTPLADMGILKANVIQKIILLIIFGKKSLILQSFYQKKIQIQLSTYRIWRIQKLSVEDKLRAIYDLQLIDSRIDEIRNVRGELPLEVEDLEDEVAGLSTRSDKLKRTRSYRRSYQRKRMQLTSTKRLSKVYKTTGNCT